MRLEIVFKCPLSTKSGHRRHHDQAPSPGGSLATLGLRMLAAHRGLKFPIAMVKSHPSEVEAGFGWEIKHDAMAYSYWMPLGPDGFCRDDRLPLIFVAWHSVCGCISHDAPHVRLNFVSLRRDCTAFDTEQSFLRRGPGGSLPPVLLGPLLFSEHT